MGKKDCNKIFPGLLQRKEERKQFSSDRKRVPCFRPDGNRGNGSITKKH